MLFTRTFHYSSFSQPKAAARDLQQPSFSGVIPPPTRCCSLKLASAWWLSSSLSRWQLYGWCASAREWGHLWVGVWCRSARGRLKYPYDEQPMAQKHLLRCGGDAITTSRKWKPYRCEKGLLVCTACAIHRSSYGWSSELGHLAEHAAVSRGIGHDQAQLWPYNETHH